MDDDDSHDHINAKDDLVFDDDDLTWGNVDRTSEVEEPRFDTRVRARASSSMLPSSRGNDTTSSSRPMFYLSLIDEDEEMDCHALDPRLGGRRGVRLSCDSLLAFSNIGGPKSYN